MTLLDEIPQPLLQSAPFGIADGEGVSFPVTPKVLLFSANIHAPWMELFGGAGVLTFVLTDFGRGTV
jgi:hypothetical protein